MSRHLKLVLELFRNLLGRELLVSGRTAPSSVIFFLGSLALAAVTPEADVDWLSNLPVASSGKEVTAIVFLSPVCPCSRHHEGALRQLRVQFPEVQFVGVYSGEDALPEDEAKGHFRDAQFGFPLLRDRNLTVANKLGAHRTPHVFVLDRKGVVLYRGAIDDTRTGEAKERYLETVLTSLRAGNKPKLTSTRPLGCRIER